MMLRGVIAKYSCWFFLLSLTAYSIPAQAADKIALIIANQHYQQKGATLDRPMADARSMMQALQQKGFQIYGGRVQTNLTRLRFENTVKQFSRQARGAQVAVVYYAGHGTQDGKANYLIPVDAKIEKALDYRYQAVELRFLLDYMSDSGVPVNLVFLDACRDNPFGTERGGSRGLLRVATPPEILVSYSTSQGATAQDQSPYTPALVRSIREYGDRNIYELMTQVAAEVVRVTSGKQRPDFSSSLTRNFCLSGCGNGSTTTAVATAPATPRPSTPRPEPIRSNGVTHSHNGRSHSHPLPAAGVNHQHSGAPQAAARPAVTTPAVAVSRPATPTRDPREPEMVFIKGGTFSMGSPANEAGRDDDERQHSVSVGNFYLGKTEVTVGEFKRFVKATNHRVNADGKGCRAWDQANKKWDWDASRSWQSAGFSQNDQHPVVCVSQTDALAYANWLSRVTGKSYGLPTEAQWEYAARSGTQTARYWGNSAGQACQYGNVRDQRADRQYPGFSIHQCNDQYVHTAPVGRYRGNRSGLQDMLGNISEWTCSAYVKGYDGSEQRCASTNDTRGRVLRGGSWFTSPGLVRSAYRFRDSASFRNGLVGFRLSRTP